MTTVCIPVETSLWVGDSSSTWDLVFGRCRNLYVNWGGRRGGGVWLSLNPLENKGRVDLAVGVVCRVCAMGASQQTLLTPVWKDEENSVMHKITETESHLIVCLMALYVLPHIT